MRGRGVLPLSACCFRPLKTLFCIVSVEAQNRERCFLRLHHMYFPVSTTGGRKSHNNAPSLIKAKPFLFCESHASLKRCPSAPLLMKGVRARVSVDKWGWGGAIIKGWSWRRSAEEGSPLRAWGDPWAGW